MEQTSLSLTVYFEEPFWRGLYERRTGGQYEVCRVTYGAEPKDQQLYEAILRGQRALSFAPALPDSVKPLGQNPKRRQRQIAKGMHTLKPSTKAQQALANERQQLAAERKKESRCQREIEQAQQFALKQAKRKVRHNGH